MKFCQFVLKILSGNEVLTTIKGHNSGTNLRKMTGKSPNLDLVNINYYIKFGEILSICGQLIERKRKSWHKSSVIILLQLSKKMTANNPNLDRINANAYMKFGEIMSICSQYIEQKRSSSPNQVP